MIKKLFDKIRGKAKKNEVPVMNFKPEEGSIFLGFHKAPEADAAQVGVCGRSIDIIAALAAVTLHIAERYGITQKELLDIVMEASEGLDIDSYRLVKDSEGFEYPPRPPKNTIYN